MRACTKKKLITDADVNIVLGKKATADKIAEKELKTEIKNMEKFKTVHENKQKLNQFFEESNLSVRALNSIKQARIETPEELFKLSNQELLSLKFGKKTINEVAELRGRYLKTLPQTSCFYISEQEKDFNIGTVEERVEWLPRFTPLSDGQMLEDLEGEYVLLSSVLNLFWHKNEK